MTTYKRGWTVIFTAFAALLLAFPVLAAKGAKAPNPNDGHGKIMAVSPASITVQPKGGVAKTFTITSTTKVKLDGKSAAATDLAVGLHARVVSKDGSTARRINAHTKNKASKNTPIPPAATL